MTPMSRGRLLLAALSFLAVSCGSASDSKTLPAWVGAYPGTQPRVSGTDFVFESKDPAEKILDFYQQRLLQNGLHMEARGGGEYGGMLSAEDDSHRRSVMINIRSENGGSQVTITTDEKK
jgi:hypothetical protein